ncbi:hydantoinase B/oxoprolinase family protein [Streptomyces sp. SHP 1-2]|uniref:hydantoinase B/oxoprolinase family protein n=1 Tax=Streptomyces sp. SHP 1-2 TaxID=2769489 RepID=UPI002237B2C4|nr:hydantoinase B/oxoprolinase family protein [Streptomyces sp. SHP 1-2]MCW5249550.1 hydantoinase B/oxoprolinase family protein [Streptomyces sp. SHP 1-2]
MNAMTDAVKGEIIQNRLMQIAQEAGLVLQRCAVSPGVVEAKDLGFNIADADGRTIVYSTWMPRHGTTLNYMLKACMERFADDIRPGDMYLVNDPHAGALHSLDLALMAPVFVDGQLVAWVGNATHHIDVGAMSPGRAPLATDWFQEGIIFKPIRLVEDSRIREDIFGLFVDNVRMPRYQSLDLKAQISANFAALSKIEDLVGKFGLDAFRRSCGTTIAISEESARERIGALADGVYTSVEHLDYDRHYTLKAVLTVKDGSMHFDLTGTDPESTTFINCAVPCTIANFHNILACQLFPDQTVNDGTFAPITFEIPSGTLLSCNAPAPCSGASTITGWKAQQLALDCISQALAGTDFEFRAQAQWGWGFTDVQWTGVDPNGRNFIMRGDQTLHGGGARAGADGIDVANIAGSTNTSITSIESYEQRYPVLYLSRKVVPDSAGDGRFRGGLAGEWTRVLYGIDEADDMTFYIGRDYGARGTAGGEDGTPSRITMKRGTNVFDLFGKGRVPDFDDLDGDEELLPQMPASLDRKVRAGDVVHVRGMGGGGYGPPAERAREAADADVREGFVTPATH